MNLTNREKKQITKRGLVWCDGCDANKIGKRQKCCVCGCKLSKRKKMLKKFYG